MHILYLFIFYNLKLLLFDLHNFKIFEKLIIHYKLKDKYICITLHLDLNNINYMNFEHI